MHAIRMKMKKQGQGVAETYAVAYVAYTVLVSKYSVSYCTQELLSKLRVPCNLDMGHVVLARRLSKTISKTVLLGVASM